MNDNPVLVIDSSVDYIDFIYRHYPRRAVFVTDPAERRLGKMEAPNGGSELLVDMKQPWRVLEEIRRHLDLYGLRPSGVACFDCESLKLASIIARELGLEYPAENAIAICRSKHLSKERWRRAGLDCPAAEQIKCPQEAMTFSEHHGGKVVIKPLTGSGSELVFVCTTVAECSDAFWTIRRRLREIPDERMYEVYETDGRRIDPRQVFIIEEHIEGTEYSCDFIIDGDLIKIVRLARKWLKPDHAPGIAMAYAVPGELPPSIKHEDLDDTLHRAARSLGIERALCMLDFLVTDGRIVLLELAPRPGGDCLPPLIRLSCGLDILGLELDVAQRRPFHLPEPREWRPLVGLRLFAPRPGGTIASLDASAILRDPRVKEMSLTKEVGHRAVLPPDDYQSQILGYTIFRPISTKTVEEQCLELQDALIVRYARQDSI
ncbi:MAG: ATP-grasp domain-containing protein [Desulfobacteraceae bacterium]|nr:MAG: ATP-grasp domain-containing protein [Desulfobacteraceae bacterium]